MLVIPVIGKNNQKQLPMMTLALIIINTIIFFFFQANDQNVFIQSMTFYQDSGLLKIESSAYNRYLAQNNGEPPAAIQQNGESNELISMMLRDYKFLSLLRTDQIIRKDMSQYQDWRQKRDTFESMQAESVSKRYGYCPVEKNYLGLFSYMFLHGSTMHLVGNMVFLYFVCALLESAIGPFFVLAGYILTGIVSALLFGFAYPLSSGPLVGASGAISGLMGGYAILFKLRKVKVFYSFGFYFNYATIPAIILLPIWLGKEFYQLYSDHESNVAYMAHIGGLLSGGLLAAVHLVFRKDAVADMFRKDEQIDNVAIHLEKGLDKMAKLDLKAARHHMCAVLKIQPDHRAALRHLFNIDKANPESDQFHTSTTNLLNNLQNHEDNLFIEIFERYKNLTKKPKMSRRTVLRLIRVYINRKEYEKAEEYVALLIYCEGEQALVPEFLMQLAEGYKSVGKIKKARTCLSILVKRFGTSNTAIRAKEILQTTSQGLVEDVQY